MRNSIIFLGLLSFFYNVYGSQSVIDLPAFDEKEIDYWDPKIFSGTTEYLTLVSDKKNVLKAKSEGSASGLMYREKIDLLKTPYINWSWQIKKKLPELNEQVKSGDDYVARIYVVVGGGFFSWDTKALNYVWSSGKEAERVWDNAYTGSNVKMLSVRTNASQLDTWYNEKRNVYQDMIRYFGDKGSPKANQKAYQYIDIIALMTDTDNSQLSAETLYGPISFSAD